METVVLRGIIAKRLVEEAKRNEMNLEVYLLEMLTQNLDPKDRAREYIEAASQLLGEAREEMEKDRIRQAAEKVWGAAALAVKAYAQWKAGRRLTSHKELWEYSKTIAEELGEWVLDAWMIANSMRICFHEGWCAEIHVNKALKESEKLVKEIREKIV